MPSATRNLHLVLALIVLGAQANAQSLEGSVAVRSVENHVRFGSATLKQSGVWFGAEGSARFGRLKAGAGLDVGSLGGSADSLHPDRSARATSIALHVYPQSWLATGLQVEARRFSTDAGITVWRLIGANVQATPALSDALEGLADITFWPAATVIEGAAIPTAMRAIFGVSYRVAPRASLRLAYRFERFDFEGDAATARLEQFRGAMLGGVIRLGR